MVKFLSEAWPFTADAHKIPEGRIFSPMDNIAFRQAGIQDLSQIWEILEHAIARRKEEGSNQWQDGYPNTAVIQQDIEKGAGYVLTAAGVIAAYCAILVNDEPEYANIKGQWLTSGDFIVYHRVAVSAHFLGKGLARKMMLCIEELALSRHIFSLKADTNHDNAGMLHLFTKLGYQYCGEVTFRGSPRKAFEKVLRQ